MKKTLLQKSRISFQVKQRCPNWSVKSAGEFDPRTGKQTNNN